MTELTQFLGWCLVLNIVVLAIATMALTGLRAWVLSIHTKVLGVSEEEMSRAYVAYLSQYKILVFVFNLVPYVSLKVMGS